MYASSESPGKTVHILYAGMSQLSLLVDAIRPDFFLLVDLQDLFQDENKKNALKMPS